MPYLGVRPADITSAAEAEIAGDLTVDTNTLKVDATNNRVGIGTLSPDRSLHITSSEPSVVLENSAQGTDLKTWRMYSNSSSLQIGTVDDAFAAGQNALEITRDNTDNITGIQFKTGSSSEIGRFTTDGLTFNGDTAAANALDDYEEGTWTPTVTPSGSGSISITGTSAKYTKIGNQVTVWLKFQISSVSSPTGRIGVSGVPFSATGQPYAAVAHVNGFGTFTGKAGALVEASGTFNIDRYLNGGINSNLADFAAASAFVFMTATYPVS